jgi:ferrous iron transport protein A
MDARGLSHLPAFPLALAGEGERVRIVSVGQGRRREERLISMGLTVGSELEVLQCQPGGAVVVRCEETRLALGAGMAQTIMVVLSEGVEHGDEPA